LTSGDLHRRDDIDASIHQFLGEIRSVEIVRVDRSRIQHEVLAFPVALVPQCPPKLLDPIGLVNERGEEGSDPIYLAGLLGLGGDRQSEKDDNNG
jgi:hypothetical protein